LTKETVHRAECGWLASLVGSFKGTAPNEIVCHINRSEAKVDTPKYSKFTISGRKQPKKISQFRKNLNSFVEDRIEFFVEGCGG